MSNNDTLLTAYDVERMAMAGGKYSKNGQGFLTCCFVHPDKTPSLSLALGDSGELLAHCFAGCSFDEIINALKRRGLLPDRQSNSAYSPSITKKQADPKKSSINPLNSTTTPVNYGGSLSL